VRAAQPQAMFAAASYKDEPAICPRDPYDFRIEQALTSDPAAVQAAITPNAAANSGWQTVGGQGCDLPEAQLNALWQLSQSDEIGNYAAGFRTDSNRIIVWFGDASGHDPSENHSITQVINSLKAAGIRVVAVNLASGEGTSLNQVPNASSTTAGQATTIANATGGVVKDSADSTQVSSAILAGLSDLPATVTPVVDGANCDPKITVAFAPTSQTVASGATADFTETVTLASSASTGTHTCQVYFQVNGRVVTTIQGETTVPDPAFIQAISIDVSNAQQQTVTVTASSADPTRLLLDLVYQCNAYSFIAALAVAPAAATATATEATWTANVDRTNACANAGGGGTLIPFVSDRWNRTGGTVKTDTASAPKAPTAAIYNPSVGTALAWNGTLALRGSGQVAGVELSGSQLTWSLLSPSGVTVNVPTHDSTVDVPAPASGWGRGVWKAVLTVGTATAQVDFAAQYPYDKFAGFFTPVANPPAINSGNTGQTFALKWQLTSGANPISDLSSVASTKYALVKTTCGAPVDLKALADTSGLSTLRFDPANMQFVFNWQTPTQTGLYVFRLTLTDGTTHDACVNLVK
ncbi:MAG: PxKF domain-containing protein, partial [Candidatus Limnocylindria bacterium]